MSDQETDKAREGRDRLARELVEKGRYKTFDEAQRRVGQAQERAENQRSNRNR